MKKVASLLLTATVLFSFGSCKRAETLFSDDIDTATLSDGALDAFDAHEHYAPADPDYLNDYFTLPDYVVDSAVKFEKDSGNLNEIGIFHVQKGHANELAARLKDYLQRSFERNRAWYQSYIPAEIPKLRDAKVKIYGNYVAYAILSNEDQTNFFEALEQRLKTSAP